MTSTGDLVREVRKIAAEHPDHVYVGLGPYGLCRYHDRDDNGEVIPGEGCLLGQAFQALGITVDECENDERIDALNLAFYFDDTPNTAGPDDLDWLTTVQEQQDNGFAWGTAVAAADRINATTTEPPATEAVR